MSQRLNRDQGDQNVTKAEQRPWGAECHKGYRKQPRCGEREQPRCR